MFRFQARPNPDLEGDFKLDKQRTPGYSNNTGGRLANTAAIKIPTATGTG